MQLILSLWMVYEYFIETFKPNTTFEELGQIACSFPIFTHIGLICVVSFFSLLFWSSFRRSLLFSRPCICKIILFSHSLNVILIPQWSPRCLILFRILFHEELLLSPSSSPVLSHSSTSSRFGWVSSFVWGILWCSRLSLNVKILKQCTF